MTTSVNFAVLKSLAKGEINDVVVTNAKTVEQFFGEHKGIADFVLEEELLPEDSRDCRWEPVVVCNVSLETNFRDGDFVTVHDGLMKLNAITQSCDIEDFLTYLFFEGFKAGMEYQGDQARKAYEKAVEINRQIGETM